MGGEGTRAQIVEAADRLFYERGYEHASFADIADAVGLSRGNFYYHFKTKDEILRAVIAVRLTRTEAMLHGWEEEAGDPAGRIRAFFNILVANQADIMRYGCPVGTLCNELGKLGHAAQGEAAQIFGVFRAWLRRQFTLLGRGEEADALAMHVLARSQGVATLAAAFRDEAFIRNEVDLLGQWLAACAPAAEATAGC